MSNGKKFETLYNGKCTHLDNGKFVQSHISVTIGTDDKERLKVLVRDKDGKTHSAFLRKALTEEQRQAVVEFTRSLTANQ